MSLHAHLDAACLTILESHYDGMRVQLLSPRTAFWQAFKYSPEFFDGEADPLDRYSKRIINPIARQFGLQASFPSDGPPYPAFISWALKSERVHLSPIGLLVHNEFGLWVSFRGAIIGGKTLEIAKTKSPCTDCAKPCLTTCPVNAFSNGAYDVETCQAHLRTGDVECWNGCLARKSCPAASIERNDEQSRFHMKAFAC